MEQDLKKTQGKRESLIQEKEDRIASLSSKHEREIEKLSAELLRMQ